MQQHGVTPASGWFRCATPSAVARLMFARPIAARLIATGLIAAGLTAMTATPVVAAERPCFPALLVFATSAKSELDARRLVLLAWANEARKHGEAFANWRLAWEKSIDCGRRPDGAYQCRATGKPCAIVQVPGTLPPGTKSNVRPKPGSA